MITTSLQDQEKNREALGYIVNTYLNFARATRRASAATIFCETAEFHLDMFAEALDADARTRYNLLIELSRLKIRMIEEDIAHKFQIGAR